MGQGRAALGEHGDVRFVEEHAMDGDGVGGQDAGLHADFDRPFAI